MAERRVLTVGHSNHTLESFLALIKNAGISTIFDVRSRPVSRWVPHFSRRRIEPSLAEQGISYEFLGSELGGKPDDPSLLKDGKPDYAAIARTPGFAAGLDRVIAASRNGVVALLCAERDPLTCHRFLMLGRELAARQVDVDHVLADGQIESQADTERRLRKTAPDDLFRQ